MIESRAALERVLDRRMLLRLGAFAGVSAALMPRLAFAAAEPELLPHVRTLVDKWVGPGKFPGMVASLGLPGKEPEYVAKGTEGFLNLDPMSDGSLFRIYSMTKPVTGMAAMQLIAQGKMALDQPLYDILPRYRHMQVQNTYDGSITDLHPARSPITIRHLLTHTAGLGYAIIQKGPIRDLLNKKGLTGGQVSRMPLPDIYSGPQAPSLEAFADRLAEVPLVYDPGTKWSYSLGLDLMGRVIEVVSGKPFDAYLKETIFEPCGMTRTFFQVPAADAGDLTTNYGVMGGVFIPIDKGENSVFLDPPPFPMGGSGLVSSPRDYDRFLRMLAQYGTIGGTRVLDEAAVRQGTSNLLPPGVAGPAMDAAPADFGAGGRVGIGPEAGIYGWAGAAGTIGMVDMAHALRSQLFVQFMPPQSLDLLPEFQTALKADVLSLLQVKPA
ncbi:serine hydrolase domain-containing protein [Novosphingobium beihaiensis]|uniref:Beta-lactamase family protein n=1 Tax=Novosphingobium beihaiensis TaxID=2930389 RepID=A0ABT0BRU8_9SPHN|nr:serine hydrolase domain-containing protein [Novosphingobium beihaiensis]MCJ2187777.1 beta-lactamase family protein [Novosphingobium beihaiensis]